MVAFFHAFSITHLSEMHFSCHFQLLSGAYASLIIEHQKFAVNLLRICCDPVMPFEYICCDKNDWFGGGAHRRIASRVIHF
jgi:hypothetical protein